MRDNGFQHLLMVDAPNWGQDWQNYMRDTAQTVLDADAQKNTVLSIHMYAVYAQASTITAYLDAIKAKGWPLVIGEFGWQFQSGEVDDATVMSEAVKRGLGYMAWSWAGNNDPRLDMTNNFDAASLTTWGERAINGANGIKANSKEATIYSGGGGTTTTTTRPSTTPTTTTTSRATTTTTRPVTTTTTRSSTTTTTTGGGGSAGCSATYTVANSWPGGFQGDVKVTAGSAAIKSWKVTWTYANGQTVTQAWNATVTSSGSTVTATNVSYNGSLAAAASTSFGFLGSYTGTNSVPAVTCTAS